jgi:NADH-quinone oxidoreductase subunit C
MADEKQPDQPGGDPKPAESAPDQEPKPEAKAPAPSKPAATKPVAKKPAVMETTPWADELTAGLKARFADSISECSVYLGQKFMVATSRSVIPILEYLKLEAGFDYLVDVTAVDYPKKEERFELVYILYSFKRNDRIRVKTSIKDGDKQESAVSVHLTANWLEREVYDMFGVEFENHPDLKRILMPDDWEGYPLRKDATILDMDQKWVQDNLGIESGQ